MEERIIMGRERETKREEWKGGGREEIARDRRRKRSPENLQEFPRDVRSMRSQFPTSRVTKLI